MQGGGEIISSTLTSSSFSSKFAVDILSSFFTIVSNNSVFKFTFTSSTVASHFLSAPDPLPTGRTCSIWQCRILEQSCRVRVCVQVNVVVLYLIYMNIVFRNDVTIQLMFKDNFQLTVVVVHFRYMITRLFRTLSHGKMSSIFIEDGLLKIIQ